MTTIEDLRPSETKTRQQPAEQRKPPYKVDVDPKRMRTVQPRRMQRWPTPQTEAETEPRPKAELQLQLEP